MRAPPARRALASMLTDNTYLAGVLTLAYSLRSHGNVLPMVLFHLDETSLAPAAREAAQRAGWQLRVVERIPPFQPPGRDTFVDQYALVA